MSKILGALGILYMSFSTAAVTFIVLFGNVQLGEDNAFNGVLPEKIQEFILGENNE